MSIVCLERPLRRMLSSLYGVATESTSRDTATGARVDTPKAPMGTKLKIAQAALETLEEEGIRRRGRTRDSQSRELQQAPIFCHFRERGEGAVGGAISSVLAGAACFCSRCPVAAIVQYGQCISMTWRGSVNNPLALKVRSSWMPPDRRRCRLRSLFGWYVALSARAPDPPCRPNRYTSGIACARRDPLRCSADPRRDRRPSVGPACLTRRALGRIVFTEWLAENSNSSGCSCANELQRHFAIPVLAARRQ
jgi:hypothetical protein